MPPMDLSGIKKAIECVGSQAELAQLIGVSPQFVWQLANGSRPIPATLVRKIEAATGGAVTGSDLRPDIFVPEPEQRETAA